MPRAHKSASARPAVRRAPTRKPKGQIAAARAAARARSVKDLRLGGVGTAAVMRATGRGWDEWLTVLDRAGARVMPHKDIALLLSRKFGVPDWWSQMVTVGYEQARGLRTAGEKRTGFAASATRTVEAKVALLYDAWKDPELRMRWLLDAPVEVRRSSDGKSMRMTWTAGGSSVEVSFEPKGANRSHVAVQHGKLKDSKAATAQKAFWSQALDRLKALLESGR